MFRTKVRRLLALTTTLIAMAGLLLGISQSSEASSARKVTMFLNSKTDMGGSCAPFIPIANQGKVIVCFHQQVTNTWDNVTSVSKISTRYSIRFINKKGRPAKLDSAKVTFGVHGSSARRHYSCSKHCASDIHTSAYLASTWKINPYSNKQIMYYGPICSPIEYGGVSLSVTIHHTTTIDHRVVSAATRACGTFPDLG